MCGAGFNGARVGTATEAADIVLERGANANDAALQESALQKGIERVALVAGVVEFVVVKRLVEADAIAQAEEALEGEVAAIAGQSTCVDLANGVTVPGVGRELKEAVEATLHVERIQVLTPRLAEALA